MFNVDKSKIDIAGMNTFGGTYFKGISISSDDGRTFCFPCSESWNSFSYGYVLQYLDSKGMQQLVKQKCEPEFINTCGFIEETQNLFESTFIKTLNSDWRIKIGNKHYPFAIRQNKENPRILNIGICSWYSFREEKPEAYMCDKNIFTRKGSLKLNKKTGCFEGTLGGAILGQFSKDEISLCIENDKVLFKIEGSDKTEAVNIPGNYKKYIRF